MSAAPQRPTAMTIAGYDPSSGAGITADLLSFEANGCFGISAVTALTVQSTTGVRRVQATEASLLTETLECLEEDLPPDGIKLGMLAEEGIVRVVARHLQRLRRRRRGVLVVLDPVLVSSSGSALLNSAGLEMLLDELLPLVDVITPNTGELEVLSGMTCGDEQEIQRSMLAITTRYPSLSVVATGGHRAQPDDTLLHNGVFTTFPGRRIETRATHGTGCAFSSALLANRLLGYDMPSSVSAAKRYVEGAMLHAEHRGAGHGPMRLLWPLEHLGNFAEK